MNNPLLSTESFTQRVSRQFTASLKVLRRSAELIVLTMRVVGFGVTSVLIGILSLGGKLSFDAGPALWIFIPYISITTLLVLLARGLRTQRSLFLLLLLDIVIISCALALIQTRGTPTVALNSLYLIVLIAASLLGKRSILFLGIATLSAYLFTTYISISSSETFMSSERVTQVAMFVLFTALAASQSYYFTYIVRKRDEEALRLKDQFVFTTAHDLRAPFALIRLLAEKYEKRQPKTIGQLKEDMEAINENVSAASRLLEDLLKLAKGENVPIEIIPIEITKIMRHLIHHWEFAMEKKGVHAQYEEPELTFVLADKQKLGYILDNVLSNAVKYNKPGGKIRIWHETKNNKVSTVIADSGLGIDKENFHKVFTPYFRELKENAAPGTGLGLYSAKKFIEQMKGTIEFISSKDGSTFTITLPEAPTTQHTA